MIGIPIKCLKKKKKLTELKKMPVNKRAEVKTGTLDTIDETATFYSP